MVVDRSSAARAAARSEPLEQAETWARVRLERPALRHEPAFLAAVERSRALHRRLVAPPRTPGEYAEYVKLAVGPKTEIFLIMLRATDQIVGVVHLEGISRSSASASATLGYYGFTPLVGRGLMREGLYAAMRYAFEELRLARLEANVQPENLRSKALIKSLGFVQEGFSPRFMKIAGRWRDHERWAILASHGEQTD